MKELVLSCHTLTNSLQEVQTTQCWLEVQSMRATPHVTSFCLYDVPQL